MNHQGLLKRLNTLLTPFEVTSLIFASILFVSSKPLLAASGKAATNLIATDNTAYGIDVSHYQGLIRWDKVKQQGITFAFAKATGGIIYTDPEFEINWHAMRAEGIIRGAYHLFYPIEDANEQAQHFLEALGPVRKGIDLPPVLNVELTEGVDNAEMVKKITIWLNVVENALGCKPIIYLTQPFAATHLKNQFGDYPLWIAEYSTQANPSLPRAWHLWSFWQYSSDEKIDGIKGSVDVDKYNGSIKSLRTFIKKLCQ